jgi:hypothetical protein
VPSLFANHMDAIRPNNVVEIADKPMRNFREPAEGGELSSLSSNPESSVADDANRASRAARGRTRRQAPRVGLGPWRRA